MKNFNFCLFLFAIWVCFMLTTGEFSWLYFAIGVPSCILTTFVCVKLGLVDKESEMLYLSIGFYRHFLRVFFAEFFSSLKLITTLALRKSQPHPALSHFKINDKYHVKPELLAMSVNMTAGLLCLNINEEELLIHALDEKFLKRFNEHKICSSLSRVNDEDLV